MSPRETWIVVADGARARFLRYSSRDDRLDTATDCEFFSHARAPTRAMVADRPTRVHQRRGADRHAVESKTGVRAMDCTRSMVVEEITRDLMPLSDKLSRRLRDELPLRSLVYRLQVGVSEA